MDLKTVENLANLAKINLTDSEKKSLLGDLSQILAYVEEINQAKLPAAPAEFFLTNQTREDQNPDPPGIFSQDLLAAAPEVKNGFIKVKKIL